MIPSSQCLFETAVPGDSMTSSGLCKYCMRIVHKPYVQAKTLVHTKLKSKKRKKQARESLEYTNQAYCAALDRRSNDQDATEI